MIIKDISKGGFEPTPQGLYPAVCYSVVDVGTHDESWLGEPKQRHSMYLTWELPTLTIEVEGITKPRAISKKFTKSLHKKAALRAFLESWRGRGWTENELKEKGFDMATLLGVNCQLNVVHTEYEDQTYANVKTIVPLSKGMTRYDVFNQTVIYDIQDGINIPEGVPDWLKSKIMGSYEINMLGQRNDEWGDNEPPQEPPEGVMREPGDESNLPF